MISEKGIEVLKLRRAASQAAASKFNALLARQTDGRVTGSFLFAGASRTQRWSGRGLQLQNLKRPPKGQDNDKVAKSLLDGSFDHRYGGPGALEVLGGSIRAAIAARDGYSLVVRDLASIESRVLGWLSGDPATMAIFRTGRDSYKDFASRWFKVPYEEVTKEQRFLSKPPTLGCGYGLGAQGLVGYAAKMGVALELEQAQEAVGVFRGTYFKIPLLWRTVEAAFTAAVPGHDSELAFLRFAREGDMVTVRLPSGRKLYYHKPEVDDDGITYMGMDQYTHKWARLYTWGGKLVENLVQAIARDVLAHGMLLVDGYDLPIVLHVHDEIGCEVMNLVADAALDIMGECMDMVPEWAPGLLLASAGYTAKRYRKD